MMRKQIFGIACVLIRLGWVLAAALDVNEEKRYHPNGTEAVYVGVLCR